MEGSRTSPPADELPIWSMDVDGAREEIFCILRDQTNMKVVYIDGWDGFGASAIVRSMAEVLPSRRTIPELCFDRIIYIDCSEWKNRRAVQRSIAEELELHQSVMAILDKQDEEDDFNNVDQSSRNEIRNVGQVINQTLKDTKLMMIFLNGSDEEVDVGSFGIPIAIFDDNIIIWTFSRRCLAMIQNHSTVANKLIYTHAFSHFYKSITELSTRRFLQLLYRQAVDIVARNPFVPEIDPTIVRDCCLYELFLQFNFHTITEFNWVSHAPNFWICDGIIQGDRAMDISNSLHRDIQWECDSSLLDGVLVNLMRDLRTPFLVVTDDYVYKEGPYWWISITSCNTEIQGLRTIPAETSSFFLAFESSSHPQCLPDGLFECANELGVLVLNCCAFDFASPPFQKCESLRFLGLGHCTDSKSGEGGDTAEWRYLCNLLVLDLRYTDWNEILSGEKLDLMTNIRELNIEGVRGWQYTTNLQQRLPRLQRLRIIKPTCEWKTSEDVDSSFVDKTSMKILDLSGNSDMVILPASISKASSLQLLVLDGCNGLESVVRLPSSLESFSFNGHGPASQWTQTVELPPEQFRTSITTDNKDSRVSKISLQGCNQLKNLFLCCLPNLVELDLSETAIKILDFNTMLVQVPRLKRLFLIGCKRLCAIIPLEESGSKVIPNLELMCIDTRVGTACSRPSINRTKSFKFQLHVVAMDARLTRSLNDLLFPYTQKGIVKDVSYNIHVTSSPVQDGVVQFDDQESLQHLIPAGLYSDVLSMVGNTPMKDFPHTPTTTQMDHHIEIAKGSCYVESELLGALGYMVGHSAESLHVHDVSIRDITLFEFYQFALKWCCVERCPELDAVFPSVSTGFNELETFWASDLLTARWIWGKASYKGFFVHTTSTFPNLQHLHLRCCPSLRFVLPLYGLSFPSLKTLHVIHCGDLVHVFELNMDYPEEITTLSARFPKLTTVHLHDLPKLQQICEVKMVAPVLESIKIRGCWSLRRLPSVGEKKPAVEIEKDVWEALEWDADHRPGHFEVPVHSCYYKEKLPRVSVLR